MDSFRIVVNSIMQLYREGSAEEPDNFALAGMEKRGLLLTAATEQLHNKLPAKGERIILQSATREALYQIPATVIESSSTSALASVVVKAVGKAERVQRRKSFRVRMHLNVTIALSRDGASDVMRGETENVSAGGMQVRVPRALELDQNVYVTFSLEDGGAPILSQGRITRIYSEVEGQRSVGIQFVQMKPEDEDRLIVQCTQRQRDSIRSSVDSAVWSQTSG